MKTNKDYQKARYEQIKKDNELRRLKAEKEKALTVRLINRYLETKDVNELIELIIKVSTETGDKPDYFTRDEVIEQLNAEGYSILKLTIFKMK
jgi:hypothetical protein